MEPLQRSTTPIIGRPYFRYSINQHVLTFTSVDLSGSLALAAGAGAVSARYTATTSCNQR